MSTKICSKCEIEKDLSCFSNDKKKHDGKYPSCKECKSKCDKKYRDNNIERILQKDREYYSQNSPTIRERSNKWYVENKEYHLERMKKYYKDNYEKIKITQKKWDELNREKIRNYFRTKYNTDINHRLKQILDSRLRSAVKYKQKHSFEYLGCDIEFFKKWIEFQFNDSMNWSNIGSWQFDHVVPCASFNLEIEEEILECYNWSNVRPLSRSDNCSKGAKILHDVIENHKNTVRNFLQLYGVPKIIRNDNPAEI